MELTDTQKNIILLALSNLVEEYYNALEGNQLTQEGKEFMITYIHEAMGIIELLHKSQTGYKIQKPKWSKEQ